MVRVGSIRISGPLSGEHILGVGSGMGPDRSIRLSSLGLVLLGLHVAPVENKRRTETVKWNV